ncbi:MAG: hypothetical protein ACOVOI_15810, partial [Hyphomicrobiales bacterium]
PSEWDFVIQACREVLARARARRARGAAAEAATFVSATADIAMQVGAAEATVGAALVSLRKVS